MNIPEILVANGTGAVLVSFLLLLRVRGESKNSVGTELFCRILVVTLLAQATETISFLLDGVPGAASRFWLYLTNTVCTGATVCVVFVCGLPGLPQHWTPAQKTLSAGRAAAGAFGAAGGKPFWHGVNLYHLGGQRLPSGSAEYFAVSAAVRLLRRERVAGA